MKGINPHDEVKGSISTPKDRYLHDTERNIERTANRIKIQKSSSS